MSSKFKDTVLACLEDNSAQMFKMSDQLFKWAEPGLREYRSSKLLAEYMEKLGFEVEMGVSGMPTAFNSEWGDEGPVIGLFAEYDATPGHSQKPVPYDAPDVPYAPGFTDAHNMLGVASCFSAGAMKAAIEDHGLKSPVELRWPEWVDRPGSEWWIPPQ